MADVFAFRLGHSIKNVDPQAVGEELERIRSEKGSLTAEAVLEAAADPASPLHAGFTWDDTQAAKKCRLAEASRLIVSYRVLNSPVSSTLPVNVFVHTPGVGRNYARAVDALSDERLRAQILESARQMVERLEKRWQGFKEAADVLDRMRQAIA